MEKKFNPHYSITPIVAHYLMRIEALKEHIIHLPINITVLASLRETARLYTTHYSTMIEGNRLDTDQIEQVIKHKGHFPGRERDEREVKGGGENHEALLRTLDPKKRRALELFQQFTTVTAAQIGQLFGFKPRTSAQLCKDWVEEGFLVVVNPSNKNRSYGLAPRYENLIRS